MQPPMPSATATWHNDTYPAISPSRPEVSAKGKTIVILGSVSHPKGMKYCVVQKRVAARQVGAEQREDYADDFPSF